MAKENSPLCTQGMRQIEGILTVLETNLSNSIINEDIEHVHQSRVASRRLRAALQIYGSCFETDTVKRWREEVKNITKSLGETRDVDVQIGYLKSLTENNTDNRPGVTLLLKKFRSKRLKLQTKIKSTIIDFENLHTIDEIRNNIIEGRLRISIKTDIPTQNFARENLQLRFSELLSLEKYIHNEAAVKRHHQLRIAAKRLRYALELSQESYMDRIIPMITTVKGFQDLLGEIHDADIWIEYIPKITRKLSHKLPRKTRASIVNDLQLLNKQLIDKRHSQYLEFASNWAREKKSGYFGSLRGLIMGIPDSGILADHINTLTLVKRVAQKYDPDPIHSKQVTTLALNLYDELSWLHNLTNRDREILEYAATLHDIGWFINRGVHSIHSREMILSDSDIPFDTATRLMVANIARYHNKGTPNNTDEKYALLLPEEAHRVDMLSAIIRVADGLDANHNKVVKKLKARAEDSSIILECLTDSDYTIEEDAIRKKRKLFKKVFGKPLRIEWKMM